MLGTGSARFERLSPRMRECLRLVYERKSSKEIVLLLAQKGSPISETTVNGYIAEAVKLLDARNRRQAAEQLHAHEQLAPDKMTDHSLRVATDPGSETDDAAPDRQRTGFWQPLQLEGSHNDLSVRQRLLWIAILALGITFGIGATANALRFINDLVRQR